MRNTLYSKLQDLPVAFHDRWQSGQLLSRAMSDLGLIRRWLSFGIVLLVVNIITIVVGFIVLFFWSWQLGILFAVLRSRVGASIQAIRDNEDAAASLGVRVAATKRLLFVLAAAGIGVAGALWLATSVTFQPKTYFSVQWTAYMIFMVLVGGIGTFEGAILGALVFFLIETWFGGTGVWYLIGLGATAVLFSLFLPRGLWGTVEERFGLRLLPVGYRVRLPGNPAAPADDSTAPSPRQTTQHQEKA